MAAFIAPTLVPHTNVPSILCHDIYVVCWSCRKRSAMSVLSVPAAGRAPLDGASVGVPGGRCRPTSRPPQLQTCTIGAKLRE